MKLAKGGGSWVIDFDFRLKVECSSYDEISYALNITIIKTCSIVNLT